jgi:hypothetical protein
MKKIRRVNTHDAQQFYGQREIKSYISQNFREDHMGKCFLACLVSLGVLVGSIAHAASYSAVSQFDLNNNPSSAGYWSYGYSETLGGDFKLFASKYSSSAVIPMRGWALVPTYYPDILQEVASGDLTASPSSIGQYAVLRWIAPYAGQYSVAVTFTGYYGGTDQTNADINVLLNGSAMFGETIVGQSTKLYNSVLNLSAGDTIDLAVGIGPDNRYDWDRVRLTETVSSVPVPGTLILLVSGLVGLFPGRRVLRRRGL